jgi:hypothetical protein
VTTGCGESAAERCLNARPVVMDGDPGSPELEPDLWRALVVTAGVGVLIGLAPSIPAVLRTQVIVVAMIVWIVACIRGAVALVRMWSRARCGGGARMESTIGLIGIAIAALGACQLELIRLSGHPALVWNIDWRYQLNLAQAVTQTGGVDAALDYAGAPVTYLVGPAWFAAAVERTFGGGIAAVSFGLVPLLCVVAIAAAVVQLLRAHHVPPAATLVSTGLAMTLPMASISAREVYWGLPGNLVDGRYWPFSSGLMLNSYFGLAVGFASITLLLSRHARGAALAVGSAGLAAVVAVKPAYFPTLGLVCALAASARLLVPDRTRLEALRLLAASAASLVGAVALLQAQPNTITLFGLPSLRPWGATHFDEYQRNTTLLLVVVLVVTGWMRSRWSTPPARGALGLLVLAAMALGVTSLVLSMVNFPPAAGDVAQAVALGASGSVLSGLQPDLGQSSVPLRLLLVGTALAVLAPSSPAAGNAWRRLGHIGAILIVLSPLGFVTRGFFQPLRVPEAAEDQDLFAVLRQVPHGVGRVIASDLADPADDYARPLRATLLTGYAGHRFYVANLVYVHFRRPDAVQRMMAVRAFFGSPWSAWHSRWLADTRIGAVLVHDRCPPTWLGQAGVPLHPLARVGHWMAFSVDSRDAGLSSASMPAHWSELRAGYGRAACLQWRLE